MKEVVRKLFVLISIKYVYKKKKKIEKMYVYVSVVMGVYKIYYSFGIFFLYISIYGDFFILIYLWLRRFRVRNFILLYILFSYYFFNVEVFYLKD